MTMEDRYCARSLRADLTATISSKGAVTGHIGVDNLPVIGRAPGHGTVHLAFGYAHTGVVGVPNTGRLIADLVSKHPIKIDLSPFSPTRF